MILLVYGCRRVAKASAEEICTDAGAGTLGTTSVRGIKKRTEYIELA